MPRSLAGFLNTRSIAFFDRFFLTPRHDAVLWWNINRSRAEARNRNDRVGGRLGLDCSCYCGQHSKPSLSKVCMVTLR